MNLLITGAWQQAAEHLDEIRKMGHEVVFVQQEKDDLPCDPAWVEGIICNGLFLLHPIEQFINLRYIQLTSAGFDRVPMNYVEEHKIEIHNARGVYSIPMAEFVVAGVLSLYKELGEFRDQQKEHRWEKRRGLRELKGQVILIVGCGSVGTECAKRFKAFGCTVLGIDKEERKDRNYDSIVSLEKLDEMLPLADVIVLAVPLTKQSLGLIDQRRLELIHGVLVNISRGAVVDMLALERWEGSVLLDVFEKEPLSEHDRIWDRANTIIIPHNSYCGDGNNDRLKTVILDNLKSIGSLNER